MVTTSSAQSLWNELELAWHSASKSYTSKIGVRFPDGIINVIFSSEKIRSRLSLAILEADESSSAKSVAEIRVLASTSNDYSVIFPEEFTATRLQRGEFLNLQRDTYLIAYNSESMVLSALDTVSRIAYFCFSDLNRLPQYELGAPFRDIFSWLASSIKGQLLHAACIGHDTGAILLVGVGGSGKSTTSSSAIGSALKFLADDYCMVQKESDSFTAYPLYTAFKLYPEEAHRLPLPVPPTLSFSNTSGKNLYIPKDWDENMYLRHAKVSAIFCLRICDPQSRAPVLTKVGAHVAMKAMAPSTLFQLPHSRAASMKMMADLSRGLPAYSYALGNDRVANLHGIENFLHMLNRHD